MRVGWRRLRAGIFACGRRGARCLAADDINANISSSNAPLPLFFGAQRRVVRA